MKQLFFIALPLAALAGISCTASPNGSGAAPNNGGTQDYVPSATELSQIDASCKLAVAGGCAENDSQTECVTGLKAQMAKCPAETSAALNCAIPTGSNLCQAVVTGGACEAKVKAVATCMSKQTPTTTGASNGEVCPAAPATCSNYFCRCQDGAVVNSNSCLNGQCQQASQHCESACQKFNHGKWTGVAGGGPTTTPQPVKTDIEAMCEREAAGGCGDPSCVSSLNAVKNKCPSEMQALMQCAKNVAACSTEQNCANEVDEARSCFESAGG